MATQSEIDAAVDQVGGAQGLTIIDDPAPTGQMGPTGPTGPTGPGGGGVSGDQSMAKRSVAYSVMLCSS